MSLVNENLWESLLKDSSKRSQNEGKILSPCVVVLSDAKPVCKSSLLSLFSPNSTLNVTQDTKSDSNVQSEKYDSEEVVAYRYFSLDESNNGQNVSLWSFDPAVWGDNNAISSLDFIFTSPNFNEFGFIILLDLTSPNAVVNPIQSLKKWSKYIKSKSDQLNKTVDIDKKVSSFGYPVVVVAATSPAGAQSPEDFQEIQRLKNLQGQLRKICIDFKFSFLLTPTLASTAQDNSGFLVKQRKFLLSQLNLDQSSNEEIEIEEMNGTLFVPNRADSLDLVGISTGYKPLPDITILSDDFSEMSDSSPLIPQVTVDIETEKDWLNNLQSFVNQVTSLSTPSTSQLPNRRSSTEIDLLALESSENASASASTGDDAKSKLSVDTTIPNESSRSLRTPTAPLSAIPSRRTSTRTAAATGEQSKQDVDNFFRNLLANPSSAKSTKK